MLAIPDRDLSIFFCCYAPQISQCLHPPTNFQKPDACLSAMTVSSMYKRKLYVRSLSGFSLRRKELLVITNTAIVDFCARAAGDS